MNFEVDFLPVGEQSKAGDAIVVRYEGDSGYYYLTVIDGGNTESGQRVIDHIRQHYGSNAVIANAILTHSDIDHACGFREIIRELDVRNIWMHRPWEFAAKILPFYSDKRLTADGLAKRLRAEYDVIADIEGIAITRGISLRTPFAGIRIGPLIILSPSEYFYQILIPQFDKGPDPDQSALEQAGIWIGRSRKQSLKATKWVNETWEQEHLRDGESTSAMNESSVVVYADFGNSQRVLLTGDAGHWALYNALSTAKSLQLPMQSFSMIQVPHHGSRSNVGPAVLNELVGPIRPKNASSTFSAYVSAPKVDDTHPRRIVLNAFIRRGGRVYITQGTAKCYTIGYDFKGGYNAVNPIAFESRVEEYE